MNMAVAHLGLGKMGQGIASNIRRAGYDLTVWNRSTAAAAEFVHHGGTSAATPAEAVAGAAVVVSSLFDDASLFEVLVGPEGALAGMSPGAVHVSTTTISPDAMARAAALHREHNCSLVGATVLGRPDKAAAGQLVSFLAGPQDAVEASLPVVAAYSADTVVVGSDQSQSAALKLTVNGTLLGAIELMSEMNAFGRAYGIPGHLITDAIVRILADGPAAGYAERMELRDFEPAGFTMAGGLKDANLVIDAAADRSVKLPVLDQARDRILQALARGWETKDWSAIADLDRDAGEGETS